MEGITKIENVQIGSDVEFFVQDRETGEIISAEGYVKGTKQEPFVFDLSSRFWATSLDNVAYEGNIPPVRLDDPLAWYHHFEKLRKYIDSTLPANLCTVAIPAHEFSEKYLNTDNARLFGCDESFCVWTRSVNERPDTNTNLRSTGKHIHASWDNMNIETIEEFIKAMDLFLGIPSVLIEPENKRRTLYGKAGEFRFSEDYDRCEYRTLSSYFAGTKDLIDYTRNQTEKAIEWVNDGNFIDLNSILAKEIVHAINNSDKEIAQNIVKEHNIPILA